MNIEKKLNIEKKIHKYFSKINKISNWKILCDKYAFFFNFKNKIKEINMGRIIITFLLIVLIFKLFVNYFIFLIF